MKQKKPLVTMKYEFEFWGKSSTKALLHFLHYDFSYNKNFIEYVLVA